MTTEVPAKPKELIRHEFDLWFTIVAEPREYDVVYTVYDISAIADGADGPELMWPAIGATGSGDDVESLKEAEVYLHGYVKWDGCSDWEFDEQERCMLHSCTREGVLRFGEVMARCWDWTAELCPHWWGKE